MMAYRAPRSTPATHVCFSGWTRYDTRYIAHLVRDRVAGAGFRFRHRRRSIIGQREIVVPSPSRIRSARRRYFGRQDLATATSCLILILSGSPALLERPDRSLRGRVMERSRITQHVIRRVGRRRLASCSPFRA